MLWLFSGLLPAAVYFCFSGNTLITIVLALLGAAAAWKLQNHETRQFAQDGTAARDRSHDATYQVFLGTVY